MPARRRRRLLAALVCVLSLAALAGVLLFGTGMLEAPPPTGPRVGGPAGEEQNVGVLIDYPY